MRRYLVPLALLWGMALAQNHQPNRLFVGAGLDFNWLAGSSYPALFFQVGDYDLLGGLGLRAQVGFGQGPVSFFEFGMHALSTFGQGRFFPYGGGGIGVVFGGGVALWGFEGLVGGEFFINPTLSLAAELAPSLYLANGSAVFGLRLRLGPNLR
ncbi:hypothetical protein [Calidithermus timidus]|jgi:hypothetical protein|uniref:hypothetical protein n=1 Tax=Calidithermus timidus TaxID=307124 RepID=UPI000368D2C8|nr:hypothetical protein [Calidithermus timidus]